MSSHDSLSRGLAATLSVCGRHPGNGGASATLASLVTSSLPGARGPEQLTVQGPGRLDSRSQARFQTEKNGLSRASLGSSRPGPGPQRLLSGLSFRGGAPGGGVGTPWRARALPGTLVMNISRERVTPSGAALPRAAREPGVEEA